MRLLLKNLRINFRARQLTIILFTVIQIVSLIALFFAFGKLRETIDSREQSNGDSSRFTVTFPDGTAYGDIQTGISGIIAAKDRLFSRVTLFTAPDPMFPTKIAVCLHGSLYKANIGSGVSAGNMVIGYPGTGQLIARVGDRVTCYGREFTVSGIRNFYEISEMSPSDLTADMPVTSVEFLYVKVPSQTERDSFTALANENTPQGDITEPVKYDPLNDNYSRLMTLLLAAVIALVLFNVFYLYRYNIVSQRRKISIWMLSGCTVNRALLLLFCELLVYFAVDLAAALLVRFTLLRNAAGGDLLFGVLLPTGIYFVCLTFLFLRYCAPLVAASGIKNYGREDRV